MLITKCSCQSELFPVSQRAKHRQNGEEEKEDKSDHLKAELGDGGDKGE